eukprot:jgi/Botrbrau1/6306/Bobra.0339s0017.1
MALQHIAALQHSSLAASTSDRHPFERQRHFTPAVRGNFLEAAWSRNCWRSSHPRILTQGSLTMDAPAPVGGPSSSDMITTANNISVSPIPRPQLDIVKQIHSEEELHEILAQDPHKLVVLECKSASCRPCKMFGRKYARLAEAFPDCLFLEIIGDESQETRKMMIKLEVKSTPTFRFYRDGECVNITTGVNENNLRSAVEKYNASES